MADGKSKSTIPAWQRSQQQQDAGVKVECTGTPATEDAPTATETGLPAPAEPIAGLVGEESAAKDESAASQLENMKSFLEDPAVKMASPEKKRAFFESKRLSAHLIEQALRSEKTTFEPSDFESFTQTEVQAPQSVAPSAPSAPQMPSAPPIITYPEFLVEAHKPPPLITPGRIVNTAYIAGTLCALLYGASKYLVTPMSLSLADARHDFAQHSQTKLDEMNERLAKLVTKLPDAKKDKKSALDSDADTETSSVTSDPTELYHRDMGTQTSPLPSRRPSSSLSSLPGFDTSSEKKKDPLTHATNTLDILQSHLSEMLSRAEGLEQPNKDRQESMNRLRTYVDNLMFANPSAYGVWNPTPDEEKKEKEKEDMIEEVKKEIRGVKGVLLSAKRFPGVAGRVGG